MSGLKKAKKYDWKDSNMALFGSDLEKDIKKAAAESEKAWQIVNQIDKEHLFIWRIVKFVPTPWPEEDYGKFYTGDSYIVLNKYKKEGEEDWEYDAHFWIGKKSTQDEYGTAAYKTVELDTFLNDKAVQHREVQNHESDLFKTYFKELTFMEGGAESGFKHVKPEEYKPRLIRIFGEKGNVVAKEVEFSRQSLNSVDCFVVDLGKSLHQWNGKSCNKDEKHKAMQYVMKLRSEHGGCKHTVLDEASSRQMEREEFMALLPDEPLDEEEEEDDMADYPKALYRLSDSSGDLSFSKVADGDTKYDMLDDGDVFFIDSGVELTVWIGRKSSSKEIQSGMMYGHNFLRKQKNPLRPIKRVLQGRETKNFFKTLA